MTEADKFFREKDFMKRNLYKIITLIMLICIFTLSACSTYSVEGEYRSVRKYLCPADNMFGFEKAVVFEDGVVAVFDKEISDRSEYGNMSYDQDREKFPAYADYTNLSLSKISESRVEEKNGKYVVTMKFEYDEANKFDPNEDIEVIGFSVLGREVTFNDGDIILYYSIAGGECFDDYWQEYSDSTGKWGEIQHETVEWPLW